MGTYVSVVTDEVLEGISMATCVLQEEEEVSL